MKYTIGLFTTMIAFWLASQHLHQEVKEYWDFVAFFVVVLGTLSVMFITFPLGSKKVLFLTFVRKFFAISGSLKAHSQLCKTFVGTKTTTNSRSVEVQLLRDGLELEGLGFSSERSLELLSQRFETHANRINSLSSWLRRCAKYPPAFGLAGTVLGLIHLMRGISTGIDTKETGIRMAVALVATFYGLIISNLFLNPLGEWLQEELKAEELKANMSLASVSLMLKDASEIETQELLNSFLASSESLSVSTSGVFSEELA